MSAENKPHVREVVLVEGRYDKHAVLGAVDATVIETGGFRIFKNTELKAMLRRLAESRGIVVLTDSDGAGFLIRSHLKGVLPTGALHAYIPDRPGKERRKRFPGAEGKLGVEAMPSDVIVTALRNAGVTFDDEPPREPHQEPVTKADFYLWGLSGRPDSAARRAALQQSLELPQRLTANALLEALNLLYEREEVLRAVDKPV